MSVHLFSWSGSYCLTRTLANSMETALTLVALYLWTAGTMQAIGHLPAAPPSVEDVGVSSSSPTTEGVIKGRYSGQDTVAMLERRSVLLGGKDTEYWASSSASAALCIAGVVVYARPTAVLFWLPLVMARAARSESPLRFLLAECVPIAALVATCCLLWDSYCYYGYNQGNLSLVLTPLNFFNVNIGHNYAAHFGTHPFHWNFTMGLPTMLGLYTPFVLLVLFRILMGRATTLLRSKYKSPPLPPSPSPLHEDEVLDPGGCSAVSAVQGLVGLSLLYALALQLVSSHQEIRFLLPCLPGLHIASAVEIDQILRNLEGKHIKEECSDSEKTPLLSLPPSLVTAEVLFRGLLTGGALLHVVAAVYLSIRHQAGTEASLSYLTRHLYDVNTTREHFLHNHIASSISSLTINLQSLQHENCNANVISNDESSSNNILCSNKDSSTGDCEEEASVNSSVPGDAEDGWHVYVLAPCHAFPGYSFAHTRNARPRIWLHTLDCSPPPLLSPSTLTRQLETKTDMTESARFETDPVVFLRAWLPLYNRLNRQQRDSLQPEASSITNSSTNTHILAGDVVDFVLTFDSYVSVLQDVFADHELEYVRSFVHADFRYDYDDPRPKRRVVLYARRNVRDLFPTYTQQL